MKNNIKTKLNKFYLYRYLAYKKHKLDILKNPKKEANRAYYPFFNKKINWDNPKNLIEKIFWLQFNTDTSLWTKYADKYQVRDYIKECGYEDNLPELFGKWNSADDIDFNELPESFVLKTNNGCGTVLVVKDKSKLNIKSTKKKLNQWLSIPYGYSGAQLHYTKITPCIIAEELLKNTSAPNEALIDYKIWCFHGSPHYVDVVFDRSFDKTKINYLVNAYDLDWNNFTHEIANEKSPHVRVGNLPKPESFNEMLEIAKVLSKGFPQVRVDFYEINKKSFVGEMTFTAGFGEYKEKFYNYLGDQIDLTKIKKVS